MTVCVRVCVCVCVRGCIAHLAPLLDLLQWTCFDDLSSHTPELPPTQQI